LLAGERAGMKAAFHEFEPRHRLRRRFAHLQAFSRGQEERET
jgi:hypothetical protein